MPALQLPYSRVSASVRGEDEDNRSNDDAKNPEEGIDCELATTDFFTTFDLERNTIHVLAIGQRREIYRDI